jgi:hypothetical protein
VGKGEGDYTVYDSARNPLPVIDCANVIPAKAELHVPMNACVLMDDRPTAVVKRQRHYIDAGVARAQGVTR